MAVDYDKICENCGKDYGAHFGEYCTRLKGRKRTDTMFRPPTHTQELRILSRSIIDQALNPPTRKRKHFPSGPWVEPSPKTVWSDDFQNNGALNMCKDTGVISVCGDPKGKGCAYYVEATHEVRCMYLSHHEYCSCVDAQTRPI